jgi:hypothetical protein
MPLPRSRRPQHPDVKVMAPNPGVLLPELLPRTGFVLSLCSLPWMPLMVFL